MPQTAREDVKCGQLVHGVKYIHTNGIFFQHFSDLRERTLQLADTVSVSEGWGFMSLVKPPAAIRCAEFHEYRPTGGLADNGRFNLGSLVTVIIILEEALEGGDFQTFEGERWVSHKLEPG